MEETVGDPPTSAVLLDHCHFSQVIFNSVEKFYVPGGDVTCYYTLTEHFTPRRKDWIGIFRVGWKTTREYYTFMWVTLPVDPNNISTKQQEVQFKAYYLPKDDEYYQFCYVDQDGLVRGASIPFQFRPENEEDILVVTTQGEVEEIEQSNNELRKENQELKDSCVSLQKQNSDMQAALQKQQEELKTLKSINKKLEQKVEEQKDISETELLQLKEQNQKLSAENEKMGVRVDQLQAQLSTQEKEMEKLVQEAQDKTEQLECLKKENFLSLMEQRKHQQKLEKTVEELKQQEAIATKKEQELTDENFDLSKRLSENKMICTVLQREKERLEGENDLLKRDNFRLMSYMGLDFDSLPFQAPTSDQGDAGQNPGLVFGNPYFGIQESSAPSLRTIKKCPTCKSNLADDVFDHISQQQPIETLSLDCPVCDKSFSANEKQIFEDHVFCHTL
ncbi:calcium-binding and coiled-coil domain-containing protein 2 isoform X1 [Myotis daubentonii]|uniref:calcium-binding and coiled-coil domain-containing protein 2 isoform X1 n=1 Tax=Myotis daubentonii TaxID=98922 RepID=UPI00287323CF|nr:calcium-binding and coiled-coil domain-containing protein 2 isoform X1 [Myotis daubentonii]XP_059526687.1 calcium-binding and coiled-coil domain-containing protein 2 isoform X1 [Myotis daubentonii]XP_059526688.1 calcium-binding and coiled-coil domain-containing protein 2 isoform X1 [Myotis daubentonii]XP_059526689.1 calcium-binding and coiled-coil domain-containing protein 2 isoform X1 [Myotis daubentonii]